MVMKSYSMDCDENLNKIRLNRKENKIWHQLINNFLKLIKLIINRNFLIIIYTFIIYFTIVGNERVFGKFMFTYALYGPINLSTSDGYLINLIYWICFCSARLITFLIAIYMKPNLLLFILVCGTLLSSIGLCVLPSTKLWFFICTSLFGLFKSPLFPATLASINYSKEISGFLIIVVNFGSAVGAMLLQYTAGRLINIYGQWVFPYLVCATALTVLITACLLILELRFYGNRFQNSVTNKDQDLNITTTSNNLMEGYKNFNESSNL